MNFVTVLLKLNIPYKAFKKIETSYQNKSFKVSRTISFIAVSNFRMQRCCFCFEGHTRTDKILFFVCFSLFRVLTRGYWRSCGCFYDRRNSDRENDEEVETRDVCSVNIIDRKYQTRSRSYKTFFLRFFLFDVKLGHFTINNFCYM